SDASTCSPPSAQTALRFLWSERSESLLCFTAHPPGCTRWGTSHECGPCRPEQSEGSVALGITFGLALDFRSAIRTLDQQLGQLVELCHLAERLGFASVTAGEGYPVGPG